VRLLVGDRQSGKTTALLDWVLDGEPCSGYPGWTRVLIVPTIADDRRLREMVGERAQREGKEWADYDFTHRIYAWPEWAKAHGVHPDTEVMVDGLDRLLSAAGFSRGRWAGFSLDGEYEVVEHRRHVAA
jgi:phage terminase large subunit-like protein